MNKINENKMKQVITAVLILSLIHFIFPLQGLAQMRDFEQNMAKMKVKLPPNIFDGNNLNISTYAELQQLKQFGLNYRTFLQKSMDAWSKLGRGQNEERKKQLLANKAYFDAFLKAYLVKEKEIQPPEKKQVAQMKAVALSDVFIGPDTKTQGPIILDSIGHDETEIQAYGHPGTKTKPTRWSAKLQFYVKYDQMEHDDAILIQVYKGSKKLGEPTPCQPKKHHPDFHVAYFECDAPKKRSAYETLFETDGVHTIKLTYKKLIEGKEFKDFASFNLHVVNAKQGAANNPSLKWLTNHDMKLSVSTIEEGINHSARNILTAKKAALRQWGEQAQSLQIQTWFKTDKGARRNTKMTCLYKDKKIIESNGVPKKRYTYWSFLEKGSMKKEEAQWTQHIYEMYNLHPRPNPKNPQYPQKGGHYLSENPGDYRCVITGDGEVLKELFFKVGADGNIVKPACQMKSMNTLHTVTLLATKDHKLSTVGYDEKLGKKFGFEGRVKWSGGCPPVR